MGINKFNGEGYPDPTAYAALKNIQSEAKNQRNNQFNQKHSPRNQKYESENQLNSIEFQKLVYVCSPLRGNMKYNMAKARSYCRFTLINGNIPIAVHLLFPQFLDDNNQVEREAGITMGLKLLAKCDEVWCFGNRISEGMTAEILEAKKIGLVVRMFDESCEEV